MESMEKNQELQMPHNAVLAGDALSAYIAGSGVSVLKKRDCLEEIQDYLRGREKRMLGLCGIHKTGRTTLLYQAIETLGQYEESILIICSPEDSAEGIRQMLCEADNRYIFVDDMGKVPDFAELCDFFAEKLLPSGKKIILTGGDGDELVSLKENLLFDRMRLIKTSYVSFREYQRFFGGSLEDYYGFRSELAQDYIRRIADKCAAGQQDNMGEQEWSVYLGLSGKILKTMDVLAEIPENGRSYHTTFTQPGLIGVDGDNVNNSTEIGRAVDAGHADGYKEFAEIQKDVIVTDLLKDRTVSGANVIAKYRSDGGEVFDIVLIHKKSRRCVAIQVENTDQREEKQARNLTDKIVCKELQEYFGGRLVGRYVFYYGSTGRAFRVQYVNCAEFLNRSAVFWNIMEKLEGG